MLIALKNFLRQPFRIICTLIFRILNNSYKISLTSYFQSPKYICKDLVSGDYSHFSYGCYIGKNVKIGNYVMCGPEVVIGMGNHSYDKPGTPIIFSGQPIINQTVIEDDVWIGQRAMIRSGIKVGEGSIIAMGSIVNKDVEPYTIVGGIPAKFLKNRFSNLEEIKKHKLFLKSKPKGGSYCRGFD